MQRYLKYLISGITCLVVASSYLIGLQPQIIEESSMSHSIARIEQHLIQCRRFIQELAANNTETVLARYDELSAHLLRCYLNGEGWIEQDVHRMIDGIAFATDKHRDQRRKDSDQTPYIIHPIGVADQLLVIGRLRDPDIIIAALLHDTIEDTETSYAEISQKFGERIADFVQEVTDDKSLAKEERKRLQIANAPHKSAGAAQIKLSDKLYNLNDLLISPPLGWPKERIKAYFEWAEQVIDRLPWVNAALKQAAADVISAYKQKAAGNES